MRGAALAVVPKVWYLFHFSSISTIFPYINLFFRRLGLSEQQIGVLAGLRPWVSFPAGSIWSGLADKYRAHRQVLLLLFGTSALLRLSLSAAGSFAAALALVLCTEFFSAAVTIIVDAAVMAACTKEGEYGRSRLFGAVGWGIFSAVAGAVITHKGIYAAFVCYGSLALLTAVPTALIPFGPLHAKLDAARAGGKVELDAEGGQEPLRDSPAGGGARAEWQQPEAGSSNATPGTGAGTLRARAAGHGGMEWEEEGDGGLERAPLLEGPRVGVPAGSQSCDPGRSPRPRSAGEPAGPCAAEGAGQHAGHALEQCRQGQQGQQPHAVHFWSGLGQLLTDPHALVFYGQVLVMGFGVGNIESYLFLFLDELGAPESLLGLSLTCTCAAEAVVFLFLGQILKALGPRLCTHLVFFAFLVRLLCYATLARWGSPWKVLPVELLHGFTFALAWGTGTAVASRIAPPGLEATAQALVQGLYFGVGYGIGGLVGGWVYQRHGAQQVYWVAFGVMLSGWLLGGAADCLLSWHVRGRQTNPALKPGMVAELAVLDCELPELDDNSRPVSL